MEIVGVGEGCNVSARAQFRRGLTLAASKTLRARPAETPNKWRDDAHEPTEEQPQ